MRLAYVVISATLGLFVSTSLGCTYFAETTPPPSKNSMMFKRDLYKGKACVEYSWVSEGKRRLIQLEPNMKEGEGSGPMAKDASHVQVYALSNGLYGLKEWQFPSDAPHSSPVVGALVELKELEAVGTVFYEDQSYASDTKALLPMPVNCPTHAEDVSRVDPKIIDLDPHTVTGNTAATLTLAGSHFTKDSVVVIDGASPTTKFISPSLLEAELDAHDLATPGKRGVKVHGAKEGTISNEVTLTVE
jgi:hypothetical protein